MKLTRLGSVVLTAAALLALTASSAGATLLEINGVKQNAEVTMAESLKSGTSLLLSDTSGFFANTCTSSTTHFTAPSDFFFAKVGWASSTHTYKSCKEEPVVVDTGGGGSIENIAGTTNGTVRSIGAKITSPSPFGALTCVTAASPGTDIGVITGVASGNATEDINAVLNCGIITAKLTGTYVTTSPGGLGITS
jgi:hypothetical protein